MLRSVLCVSVVCGLALDSNTIRSSKESALQSSELPVRRGHLTLCIPLHSVYVTSKASGQRDLRLLTCSCCTAAS